MFTGIVENLGQVVSAQRSNLFLRVNIKSPYRDLKIGESVAVNGVCLTIEELELREDSSLARFCLSPETMSRSNLGSLVEGSIVNLERALPANGRLSGHMVQGHVDGLGEVIGFTVQGDGYLAEFRIPEELGRYCVEKGSIALNGVSLTINSLKPSSGSVDIGITLIPHTWTHTNFANMKAGDFVNVEVDVLAKYVEQICRPYLKQ